MGITQNDDAQEIRGGSTGAIIGNNSDRLKVNAQASNDDLNTSQRQRVSNNNVIFSGYFVNDDRDLLFNSKTTGGGAVSRNSTTRNMELTVGTADGDYAAYQSRYQSYTPSHAQVVYCTATFDTNQSNLIQRVGYFDDNDGLFFEYDSTGFYVVVRTSETGSPVDTRVEQASWNTDVASDLDLNDIQFLSIDFNWGGGVYRFGYLDTNGERTIVHEGQASNVLSTKFMTTANLPLRFEIQNDGATSGSSTLKMHSGVVSTEGEEEQPTAQHAIDNDTSTRSISSGSFSTILAVRLKSGFHRAQLVPSDIGFISTTNDDVLVRVYYNATITGGSWTSAGANSIAEYNDSMTGFSGGELVASKYVSKQGGEPLDLGATQLVLQSDFDGTTLDNIIIVAKTFSGSAGGAASIIFTELY